MITKQTITTRAISYQLAGYGILMFLIAGGEVFDFPHNVFGAPPTPVNWTETAIEGAYIALLCAFTVYLSLNLLNRIKFLEGFLPICLHCKKICKKDVWTSLEEYVSDHSEALFSHGVCPDCLEKHYPEHLREVVDTSPGSLPRG